MLEITEKDKEPAQNSLITTMEIICKRKMKYLILMVLAICFKTVLCQRPCDCFYFDDTTCLSNVFIDTLSNDSNIWHIGISKKANFNVPLSYNSPGVIITDTVNTYPVNNNSSFIIKKIVDRGDYYGLTMFSFFYCVQSDSLHDYGKIEISADNGKKWIDMINDTSYNANFSWWSKKPVLTGRSNGWENANLTLADLGSLFDIHLGDTLLYRFTFISDSIKENLGGLMFDEICFMEFIEGISEVRFMNIKSKIFPNPSDNVFNIEFNNPAFEPYNLSVYDNNSRLIKSIENIRSRNVMLDAQKFNKGIYFYKLTNQVSPKRSWGKFIVN